MKKLIILIVLLVCGWVYAVDEIVFIDNSNKVHSTTMYCRVVKGNMFTTQRFWIYNTKAKLYQADPNWIDTVIPLVEVPTAKKIYKASMPLKSPAGLYFILFYDNANPVSNDVVLCPWDMKWDGTKEIR